MVKSFTKSNAFAALAAGAGRLYLRLLGATSSQTIIGRDKFDEARAYGRGVIVTFWHSRLMLAPFMRQETDADINMLISTHRDGALIANAVKGFGINFIRGSSANLRKPGKMKQGAPAVAHMLAALKRGEVVAITPDGPRGPAEVFQPGAIRLAQRSGAPILLVGAAATCGRRMNSWDRFFLPLPFARFVYLTGAPIIVPADADADAVERLRAEAQSRLIEATQKADEMAADEMAADNMTADEMAGGTDARQTREDGQ